MSTAYEYIQAPDDNSNKLRPSLSAIFASESSGSIPIDIGPRYEIIDENVDSDGVTIRQVDFYDISEDSPEKEAVRTRIADYVEQVSLHPEWEGPSVNESGELVCSNPVSAEMYSEMPAMASWRRELVPGAVALYPLQCPGEKYLPNGIEIDDETRAMFTNSLDAIGIRTRAEVMSHIAANYMDGEEVNWASLACGAAVPVVNAIKNNRNKINNINLKLIDFDPEALNFATALAESRGLTEGGDFETMNRDLLRDLIITDGLVDELGTESMDFVDALGIFEYFKDRRSAQFLANAYKLVKPGGAIVVANMLDTHPEILFNQRVIGWPTIYPRSIEELKSIVQSASIDLKNVSITVPSDGIYAVLEIQK